MAHEPGYTAVQKIPGIGPTLVAVLVAEIGDVSRFASALKLTCWAGPTPKHHRPIPMSVVNGAPNRAHVQRSPRESQLALFIERLPLRIETSSPSSPSAGRSYVLERHAEGLVDWWIARTASKPGMSLGLPASGGSRVVSVLYLAHDQREAHDQCRIGSRHDQNEASETRLGPCRLRGREQSWRNGPSFI